MPLPRAWRSVRLSATNADSYDRFAHSMTARPRHPLFFFLLFVGVICVWVALQSPRMLHFSRRLHGASRRADPTGDVTGTLRVVVPQTRFLTHAYRSVGVDPPPLLSVRYLMISGSRPGGQPLNLQGIWANSLEAKWQGDYHMNINLQVMSSAVRALDLLVVLVHFRICRCPG